MLETQNNFDQAILSGFSNGLDVGTEGLTKAFWHLTIKAAPKLRQALNPTKRSERLKLPGPKTPDNELARSSMLDLMLDRDPMNPRWSEALLKRFGGDDAVEFFQEDEASGRIREELRLLSFRSIWGAVKAMSREDLEMGHVDCKSPP